MARPGEDMLADDPPSDVAGWASLLAICGDPNRLTLLLILKEAGTITVADLVHRSGIAPTSVSHALRLLRAHGLVSADRYGRFLRYRIDSDRLDFVLDPLIERLRPVT